MINLSGRAYPARFSTGLRTVSVDKSSDIPHRCGIFRAVHKVDMPHACGMFEKTTRTGAAYFARNTAPVRH
jgi:hypothetical protein